MDIRKGNRLRHPFHYVSQTIKLLLLGALITASIYAIDHIKLSRYFLIRTVRVYGLQRVEQQELRELLTPLVSQGFFTINVEMIRDRLLQIPWVSDIFVKRSWPDRVDITVIEKQPMARWNHHSLLSTAGELFTPKLETQPEGLPELIGPEGRQIVMLDYFNEINRLFLPLRVKISYLELTPYFTWKMALDNGIMLQIGHKDILTRLRHFVKVYPKIVGENAAGVEYIDLRYSNGVAVKWKSATKT